MAHALHDFEFRAWNHLRRVLAGCYRDQRVVRTMDDQRRDPNAAQPLYTRTIAQNR
jgi:hypothetical protein